MSQEDRLEHLREELYSTTAKRQSKKPVVSSKKRKQPPHQWRSTQKNQKKGWTVTTWFLLISGVFFVIAAAAATLIFLLGGRTVSVQNLELSVQVPGSTDSGETIEGVVVVRNTNPVPLPFVEITVTFPEGTRKPADLTEALPFLIQEVGPLAPGESAELPIQAVFFGEEGEDKEVGVAVEFRAEDSNAVVVKETSTVVNVASAPLGLTVDAPTQVAPGEVFPIEVRVQGTGSEQLNNIVLMADYPFGFTPRDIEPNADLDDRVWRIDELEPGDNNVVTMSGEFVAQSGSTRTIRFMVGTDLTPSGESLDIVYAQRAHEVQIGEANIGINFSMNGQSDELVVARAGSELEGRITIENQTDGDLFDAEVAIALSGDFFSSEDVDVDDGLYSPRAQTITFSRDTEPSLSELGPGEDAVLRFSIPLLEEEDLLEVQNPELVFEVNASAREISANNVPGLVERTIQKNVRVRSDLTLESELLRTTGSFENTGPWPFQADRESTVTLVLTAANTYNTVANAEVTLDLPPFVSFAGRALPAGADVSYQERTGALEWQIGELSPYSARELVLQLVVLPTDAYAGTSPVLVSDQRIEGVDRFTQRTIVETHRDHTTRLIDDPAYRPGYEVISP